MVANLAAAFSVPSKLSIPAKLQQLDLLTSSQRFEEAEGSSILAG